LAKELLPLARTFLFFRGLLFAFAFFATAATKERHPVPEKLWEAFAPSHFFLNGFFHWDAGWYRQVAERGYFITLGLPQNDVAFFPLFPYLARWLGMALGSHLLAGVLLANLTFFMGLFYLARIARMYLDEDGAERTVLLVLLFPASWFFSAYYSEGLFLGVTTASFFYFLRGKYLPCALFGALACATRSTGIALLPAFAIGLAWEVRQKRVPFRWASFSLLLIPTGLLVFMWMLHSQVGDPLAFAKSQMGWGRQANFPLLALYQEFSRVRFDFPRSEINTDLFLSGVAAVAFLILPLFLIRRVHLSLVVYAELALLLPLSTNRVMSMIRFAAVAFPSFLALAMLARTRPRERLVFFGMTLFLGFYTLQFFNWHWAG
jgi:hypothetical protein